MEGDSNKKLTPPWFMGRVAGNEMSGSLFWSFTYNAPSCKWLYVCIILFIIYECFFYFNGKSFLWLKQVDLRVHNRNFSVTQAQFLGTSIHVGVVSELLSCLHCCTVQAQEPPSRDAEGLPNMILWSHLVFWSDLKKEGSGEACYRHQMTAAKRWHHLQGYRV